MKVRRPLAGEAKNWRMHAVALKWPCRSSIASSQSETPWQLPDCSSGTGRIQTMDLGGYWARHWSDHHLHHEWKNPPAVGSVPSDSEPDIRVYISASQHISVVSDQTSGFFSSIAEIISSLKEFQDWTFLTFFFVFIYWFSPRLIPRLCNKPCFIRNLKWFERPCCGTLPSFLSLSSTYRCRAGISCGRVSCYCGGQRAQVPGRDDRTRAGAPRPFTSAPAPSSNECKSGLLRQNRGAVTERLIHPGPALTLN